ncbi:TMEM43 family protein [Lysobacter sp. S4-A87]|uniref:TMEM43 family protein n=1 Tax=Lysobacter sp. S4-A87 TaxID=2925843 RepID=UPI001F53A2CE|nr:TMEM43 family protein [Lysobacter sp. S4-A87]UNK50534.1 TMEM43 family protein [Lysobacter sp. S4-A87]
MTPRGATAWLSLACALAMGAAWAQPAVVDDSLDPPKPGKPLQDRDFGVGTRSFGLDRKVEMYQWRANRDGYARVWNSAAIDSSHFAAGHANPKKLPLDNRRWWSEDATLEGKPIDLAVLQTLGQWRVFRPNFSRLPANLAASFQPEGDGLGSAENPLDPQIGDIRIIWRELSLPPLEGKVELRGDRWVLSPEAAAQALSAERASTVVELPPGTDERLLPWLLGATAMLLGAALVWRRMRRRRG